MFERYTPSARRVIFLARYEASQFGTPYIEAEFLLLALFREEKELMSRLLPKPNSAEQIRKQIESHTVQGLRLSTSVDIPLSDECKRALAYANEESERLNHRAIGSEHLLLGVLREQGSFAATLLVEQGVTFAEVEQHIKQHGPAPSGVATRPGLGATAGGFTLPFSFPVTTVRVSDLPTSTAFYLLLGFKLAQEIPSAQLVILSNGPFQLALVHQSMAANLLCFMVGDLRSVAHRVEAAGYTPEQPITRSEAGLRSLLLRDPDGNLVLLLTTAPISG